MLAKRLLALSALMAGTWAADDETTVAPSATEKDIATATSTGTGIQTYTVAVGAVS